MGKVIKQILSEMWLAIFVVTFLWGYSLAARIDITPVDAPTSWATSGSSVTWTTGSPTSSHSVTLTGREMVIALNMAGTAKTVTLVSVADKYGRTGDATYDVPADSGVVVFQIAPTHGWQQSDGKLYINVESSDIKLAVIKFP